MLAAGKHPQQVIAELLADDRRPEQRQLAILDAAGRAAAHNPSQAGGSSRYWGSVSGAYYSCQGNTLAGRAVVTDMATAYEETKGTLADRLMAALLAGEEAGGDHRGRLAAGIRLAKPGVKGYWFELYVDESDDAVAELVEAYLAVEHEARGEWKPSEE